MEAVLIPWSSLVQVRYGTVHIPYQLGRVPVFIAYYALYSILWESGKLPGTDFKTYYIKDIFVPSVPYGGFECPC
jgi:hypothetical protein